MMLDTFLLLILLICVITDLKNRKIYNKVIYPALLVTFIYHSVTSGLEGLSHSFIGFLIGLSLLLIPYLMGGMGAGDVKLLALIGAMKGGAFVFQSFLYIALLGAVLAIGIIIFRSGVVKSIVYYVTSLKSGVVLRGGVSRGSLTATYPYGVAIAGGAVLCMVMQGWRFL
ncbi:A24 family peptidase [Virgibacillus litoralis]|uniref:Prepilin peptidase CpaA n=1 Tax=Virgibacillus litoralis TaxID=578221 RepID=A0ABS4HB01_9BACI|nr:prepilin peptidase [Virgibacillus litoralis]MBP1948068.1 prepilin peptidase CpaA [Virgibacillus litoralis]